MVEKNMTPYDAVGEKKRLVLKFNSYFHPELSLNLFTSKNSHAVLQGEQP